MTSDALPNDPSGMPIIEPCARCGYIPARVEWDCSDAPRVMHSQSTCDHYVKERKAIDAWNAQQREATRDTPF